ncbi:MAG: hypothetical protein AAFP28_02745 [Pseudomonadota bacterium]
MPALDVSAHSSNLNERLVLEVGGIRAEDLDGGYLGGHQAFWFACSQFYLGTEPLTG